jgi:hypothetical protein
MRPPLPPSSHTLPWPWPCPFLPFLSPPPSAIPRLIRLVDSIHRINAEIKAMRAIHQMHHQSYRPSDICVGLQRFTPSPTKWGQPGGGPKPVAQKPHCRSAK